MDNYKLVILLILGIFISKILEWIDIFKKLCKYLGDNYNFFGSLIVVLLVITVGLVISKENRG